MSENDLPITGSDGPGGGDVFVLLGRMNHGTCQASHPHPIDGADGDKDKQQPPQGVIGSAQPFKKADKTLILGKPQPADIRLNSQHNQEYRYGVEEINEPHHDFVNLAAEIPCQGSIQYTNDNTDG